MIKLTNLNKFYNKGKANEIHVINNTSLEFPEKGLVALTGPSGCGKTTLLNVIGGLDKFDSGVIDFDNQVISKYKPLDWDIIRNKYVGYIFQNYNLVDDKTVYENIELALNMAGLYNKEKIEERINYVLTSVGMYNYRRRNVQALSGGQQQRIAIARAIAKNPKVVLADEPTGNLDANNTFEIMSIIKKISQECLVILVSHERGLVDFYADHVIELADGKVINQYDNVGNKSLEHVDERIIYLKDLVKDEKLHEHNIERYYDTNKDESLSFQIVEVKDSVYIKAVSKKKVKYLTDETEIRLVNEHYKAKQSEDALEYVFDLEQFGDIKHQGTTRSFVKMQNTLVNGFKKLFGKRKIIGKLFLLGYFVISALVAYQIATFANLTRSEPQDFLSVSQNLISISDENGLNPTDIDYIEEHVENVEWSPYYRRSSVVFYYYDFYQGYALSGVDAYPMKASFMDDADLIYGRMPENNKEIVVDKWLLEEALEDKRFADLGVSDLEDFLGENLYSSAYYYDYYDSGLSQFILFEIVGIIDTDSPTVVVADEAIYGFLESLYESLPQGVAEGRYELISGKEIENKYEVLVGVNRAEYLESNILTYRDVEYNVVGVYEVDPDSLGTIYNDGFIFADSIFESWQKDEVVSISYYRDFEYYYGDRPSLYFYSDDIDQAIEDINNLGKGYIAADAYASQKDAYVAELTAENISKIRSVIIIMAGIIVYIFFMMRSSMLNRIKEIGIYRSIGATKRDIYKIFMGEIIAMTTLGSLTGYLTMSFLIYQVQTMVEGTLSLFYLPIHYFFGGIALIYLINMIFGMLPVLGLLRKTPSEINSKYDI